MNQHWNVQESCLEISEMPFYWRLSADAQEVTGIQPRLPIRIQVNEEYDYLQYIPSNGEWATIEHAYRQNENIGFLNPESGQLQSYGSSVNNFFHEAVKYYSPKAIYEIGCGAGFSIQFLKDRGWQATGIDPSQYSLEWSKKLGFKLINAFFTENLLTNAPDFIYCNDVFEHIRDVEKFSQQVYNSLEKGGVFCFATTNSTQSIAIGDISMLEHQHVNMFTERSIYLILQSTGFSDITVSAGSYGSTFHVHARKAKTNKNDIPMMSCQGFLERAEEKLFDFDAFYKNHNNCNFYVPLRCIPYLASVGDFGDACLFDSNTSWKNKYIDGYTLPINSLDDVSYHAGAEFFVGSLTFFDEIKKSLIQKGFPASAVFSILEI